MAKYLLISLLALFVSCNIFNPGNKKIATLNADGYIQEGEKWIREGDYVKAMSAFTTASTLDPSKSEAWYGIAKTAYLQSGFNVITLLSEINSRDSVLPFLGMTQPEQNNIYIASRIARNALFHVAADTLFSDRVIKPVWVKLDYATSIVIYSILRLKDFNGDGIIDANDNLLQILQIRIDSNGFHMLNFDSLVATDQGRAQFNQFLDSTASFVEQSFNDLSAIFVSSDSTGQAEGLTTLVGNLATGITYYKVGDALDNDGDAWDTNGDGVVQPMVWNDLDGDNKIDIGPNHLHIQCKTGILTDPQHYIRLDVLTYNSRPDLQPYWPKSMGAPVVSGKLTYTGVPAGEWLSGDYGVDEEIRDQIDNEEDGIYDEDSRIAK